MDRTGTGKSQAPRACKGAGDSSEYQSLYVALAERGGIARLSHCLCESLVPKRVRFGTAVELGFVGVPGNR